jgi:hypothetical protein
MTSTLLFLFAVPWGREGIYTESLWLMRAPSPYRIRLRRWPWLNGIRRRDTNMGDSEGRTSAPCWRSENECNGNIS